MAYEDFTTYDEVDPGDKVTIESATKISWNDLSRATQSHVTDDKGLNHFAEDFTHQFEAQYSDPQGVNAAVGVYAISTIVGSITDQNGGSNGIDIQLLIVSGNGRCDMQLHYGASRIFDPSVVINASTTYYFTLVRDDDGGTNGTGKQTLYIRTGSHEGELVDTLVLNSPAGQQNDYQYIYGMLTHESYTGTIDGFTQNLDINESSPNGDASFSEAMSMRKSSDGHKTKYFNVYELNVTCDSGDGSCDVTTSLPLAGKLNHMVTKPGTTAPTSGYDVTIKNASYGVDILNDSLFNLSESVPEIAFPLDSNSLIIEHGLWLDNAPINIVVANNSVQSAQFTIYFFIEK